MLFTRYFRNLCRYRDKSMHTRVGQEWLSHVPQTKKKTKAYRFYEFFGDVFVRTK